MSCFRGDSAKHKDALCDNSESIPPVNEQSIDMGNDGGRYAGHPD